ncbi:Histone deacetylase-like amidohydrolase [Thermoflexales bacterium]|nr:Histone deacetylase-like amidohydrolase [Thermoflexales bacterium]
MTLALGVKYNDGMATGYLYDPVYLQHAQTDHVEGPERLTAINDALDETGMRDRLVALTPEPISSERLSRVHHTRHIERVRAVAERGGGGLMGLGDETYVAPRSYEAACLAAGAVVSGVEAVLRGEVKNAFALVRPPGHHAFADHGEGFCLFNNVALAAATARAEFNLERVLIVDFDVHHGNGTNAIFYRDPGVLFFSTHQWGIYPGTGYWDEVGVGAGVGYSVNVPMLPGWGDEAMRCVFDDLLVPIARRFQPQLLLVSAGYDPSWTDRLGSMLVTTPGFFNLTRTLTQLADELCDGRLGMTLEGGYGLAGLAYGVVASFAALLGDGAVADPVGPPRYAEKPFDEQYLKQLRALHGLPPA